LKSKLQYDPVSFTDMMFDFTADNLCSCLHEDLKA
jgi:hypothetical protein